MKTITRFLIYPLLLMGMLISSCNKDESTSKNDPVITWANPADISFGTLLSETQLNATSDVPGTFFYTPAIGTQLNVGENQSLKVDFTPTDVASYNTASKTVKINITVATTVTDIDGNVYHFVTIGTQTWMLENLKTTKYSNGDPIPNVTDSLAWENLTTGAYCNFNNDESNSAIYGSLYNWYSVNDSRKLAPVGWHVPNDSEWRILTDYLGGEEHAGSKLKETGNTHWFDDNSDATNESGFTGLPGGQRNYNYNGQFWDLNYFGYWWSCQEYSPTTSFSFILYTSGEAAHQSTLKKASGFSVRCLKDN